MSDDLLITPGSRKQEFKDSSGNVDAKIETDSNGNLTITNPGGDISIGDTTADIFVGDGANNVDIVFEQNGEIRGTSGVTITLGASGSNVAMATDLSLGTNDITNVGTITAANLNITGTTTTVNSTNTTLTDNIIELNSGLTGANTKDIGFIFERGSTGSNAAFIWDESADRFTVITTTGTAADNTLSGTVANFQAGSFYGNGANLTSLNASNISSGTVADARIAASSITQHTDSKYLRSNDTDTATGLITLGNGVIITKASSDQNTSQDSASIPDTTGPEIVKFQGSYTDGKYTTEFAKVDRSGNLPLYVRQSKGTANSFTNIARFGDHGQSNGTDVFAVFGGARVGGRVTADNLTLNSLSGQSSEATALMINGSNVVGTRELGSNAFNSTTIPTNNNQLTNGAGYLTSVPNHSAALLTSGTVPAARIAHNTFDIGDTTAETGRSVHETGIYTFNRNNGTLGTGTESAYYSVLAWGQGTGGSAQLASKWTSNWDKLYFRSLRDTTDNWSDWREIYHTSHKPTYTELGTMAYSNLTGTPTIPTNNNQLTNGAGYITGNQTITLGGDVSGSGTTSITVAITDDSHFHHRLDSTDDRDMKPSTSGIATAVQAIKPFFSSYGGMTGSGNSTYLDVLALDTYSDSSGGGPSAITFKKGNGSGNPEMHIWHAAWNATTWGAGQRVFADNYHPNADTLTTARTIAGTSFNGSANININFDNLSAKASGTGTYSTSGVLQAGRGSGGVSLTVNDGYGNANVTFNHASGVPEQNGQSARIETNTDNTSSFGQMVFEVSSSDVTSGVAVTLTEAMTVNPTTIDIPYQLRHKGDNNTHLQFDSDRIRLTAGNVVKFDSNNTYLTSHQDISGKVDIGSGFSDNRVLTAANSDTAQGESNLTFNGSTLAVTGDITTGVLQLGAGNSTAGIFRTGSGMAGLHFTTAGVLPTDNAGAVNNGVMDLGGTSNRFDDIHVNGVHIGSTNTSYDLYNNGTSYFNGAVTVDDELTITNKIIHSGDTDTYFQFHAANQARIVAGNNEITEWRSDRMQMSNKPITFSNWSNFSDDALTDINYATLNAPIHIPAVNIGTANKYLPILQGSAQHTQGYRTNYVFGGYKQGTTGAGWGDGQTGFFMGMGGSDTTPTKEFRFTWDGRIWYTDAGAASYLDFDTANTLKFVADNNQTLVLTSTTATINANLTLAAESSTGGNSIHLPRNGMITFYGDTSTHHAIGSRNQANGEADDILISSYGAVYIDLDSNNNNDSGADFVIGTHNATNLNKFAVSGENGTISQNNKAIIASSGTSLTIGDVTDNDEFDSVLIKAMSGTSSLNVGDSEMTLTGDVLITENIRHAGDVHTRMQFTADRIRLYSGNVEMLDLVEGGTDYVDIIDRVRVTAAGDMICEGDVVAFTTTTVSDINQKENIKPIKDAISKVKRLAGVTFDWKKDKEKSAGIIAQDVEKVLPEIVKQKEDRSGEEFKSVDYNGIIGLLVEGMKEQQEEIEKLKELLENK